MTFVHEFLDTGFDENGLQMLREHLRQASPESLNERWGEEGETTLHVAVRRRRPETIEPLLDAGADIEAINLHGKTAWTHAVRRGFDECAECLESRGAEAKLAPADLLAIAIVRGDLKAAKQLLAVHPKAVRTGNPGEDRLLADMAGRDAKREVQFLIDHGADLNAPALDGGTPLHQAAWFGQPEVTAALIEAGADLDVLDSTHRGTALGWAYHGRRCSGGAESRQAVYQSVIDQFREAGLSRICENPEHEPGWING